MVHCVNHFIYLSLIRLVVGTLSNFLAAEGFVKGFKNVNQALTTRINYTDLFKHRQQFRGLLQGSLAGFVNGVDDFNQVFGLLDLV